ncbi:MAG: rod shape-determining protein MreC [Wenzhouxiangella sp.]
MNPRQGAWTSSLGGDPGRRTARLMFYALLAIVLMTLDYRGGYVDRVHDLAVVVMEPVVLAVEAPFALGRRLGEELRSRHELLDREAVLERELRMREAELIEFEELRAENRELRELLGTSRRLELDFRAAELIKIDLDPYSHRVVVNRGRRDGIAPGQTVIDAEGVIGQVDRVALNSAQVILISDPDHALPVRVRRTDFRTIAYGTGRINTLRLNDLPMNVDLDAGDELVTSGLGGVFPPGLPVARIESVARPAGEAFAHADARPLGRLDRVRHVLLVDTAGAFSEAEPAEDDDDDASRGEQARVEGEAS